MKEIIPLLLAATLVGCGKPEPTTKSNSSAPTETIESLAANPERLKELRQQCKTDRAKLGDELCNRVAEATNRALSRRRQDPLHAAERISQVLI